MLEASDTHIGKISGTDNLIEILNFSHFLYNAIQF